MPAKTPSNVTTQDGLVAQVRPTLLVDANGEAVGQPTLFTATIAATASLSDAVDLGSLRLARVEMPDAWTAANLTIQVSSDGVAYRDLYDGAAEFTITAAANRAIVVEPTKLAGARYLKIRSGTAATPVVQAAARALTIVATAR